MKIKLQKTAGRIKESDVSKVRLEVLALNGNVFTTTADINCEKGNLHFHLP